MRLTSAIIGSCLGLVVYILLAITLKRTSNIDLPEEDYNVYVLLICLVIGYVGVKYAIRKELI